MLRQRSFSQPQQWNLPSLSSVSCPNCWPNCGREVSLRNKTLLSLSLAPDTLTSPDLLLHHPIVLLNCFTIFRAADEPEGFSLPRTLWARTCLPNSGSCIANPIFCRANDSRKCQLWALPWSPVLLSEAELYLWGIVARLNATQMQRRIFPPALHLLKHSKLRQKKRDEYRQCLHTE